MARRPRTASAAAARGPRAPVFVGGTGRCGTHAVASLIAAAEGYAAIPAELRLHVGFEGIAPFAVGAQSRAGLLRNLPRLWRQPPPWDPEDRRGLHRVTSRPRLLAAATRLALAPPGADRLTLSRGFVDALVGHHAPSGGAWVEKTPANCAAAAFLAALYPGMRLIHVVRDGRDVACSFMRVPWAPDDFEAALALWERSLLEADRGARRLPPGQRHRIALEELVAGERELAYRGLLAFLGIADGPPIRRFFERELTPERARIGRWRADLPRSRHAWAEGLYTEALERLAAQGVSPPRTEGLPAAARPAAPSPLDPWAAATA